MKPFSRTAFSSASIDAIVFSTLAAETPARIENGPGPNVATGDYRRSWHVSRVPVEGAAVLERWASVETNQVQAARLEYGFVGRDSLGRRYRQPAYPHMRPAADEVEPMFFQWADDAVVAALLHGFDSEAGGGA